MEIVLHHRASFFKQAWKILALTGFIVFLSAAGYAQNQSGDKPVNNKKKLRELRYKSRSKKGDRARTKDVAGRRIRRNSSAGRAATSYKTPRAARRKPSKGDDRVGKALGRTVGSQPHNNQRAWRGSRASRGSAYKPHNTQHPVSNRAQLSRLKKMQSDPNRMGKARHDTRPRSASRAYISRKSINPLTRFRKKSRQGDRPETKDLAGRSLRSKNFHTPKPALVPSKSPYPKRMRSGDRSVRTSADLRYNKRMRSGDKPVRRSANPYGKKMRSGDRAFRGRAGRTMAISSSAKRERGWKGDVAGRKIRGSKAANTQGRAIRYKGTLVNPAKGDRARFSKRRGGGYRSATEASKRRNQHLPFMGILVKPAKGDRARFSKRKGGGYKSASKPGEKRTGRAPLPVRTPGIGASSVRKVAGKTRGERPIKGGGSVSGKRWNNNHSPIKGRTPSNNQQRAFKFQGNTKASRPLKGGGSVSGKVWNNRQSPINGRPPSSNQQRAFKFQGNAKARRPLKGGGSVSGKLWNNKETPVNGRPPSSSQQRAFKFQGNTKAHRPPKGGGSVSGKLWNNKETPINSKPPSSSQDRAFKFQGNIRGRREEKGGGSRSGKLWNNKEKPINVRPPSRTMAQAHAHRGSYHRFEIEPSMQDQGEEFTGYIKLKRFKRNYLPNPNAHEDAPKKARPDKSTYQVGKLQVKVKKYHYMRNPSSADDALKVREPSLAFARASDYQGNIKMKKFELYNKKKHKLHPDAQFVKINKNNVAGEKSMVTNFKLWWGRLFRKNETLPDHLKDKEHKPRYDKGEKGMWND